MSGCEWSAGGCTMGQEEAEAGKILTPDSNA